MDAIEGPEGYKAFVIGSEIYYGSWMKVATEWVHRNRAVLAHCPMWLFNVGQLGTDYMDNEQPTKEKADCEGDT